VTTAMRQAAKPVSFGSICGIGPRSGGKTSIRCVLSAFLHFGALAGRFVPHQRAQLLLALFEVKVEWAALGRAKADNRAAKVANPANPSIPPPGRLARLAAPPVTADYVKQALPRARAATAIAHSEACPDVPAMWRLVDELIPLRHGCQPVSHISHINSGDAASLRAEPVLPAAGTPDRIALEARHREMITGMRAAAMQRPPSWASPSASPSPGCWCSCCHGRHWWQRREAAIGWCCSTCHPPAPGVTTTEVRT
jgi:hypothetical protein